MDTAGLADVFKDAFERSSGHQPVVRVSPWAREDIIGDIRKYLNGYVVYKKYISL
jgi:hypothetical protein